MNDRKRPSPSEPTTLQRGLLDAFAHDPFPSSRDAAVLELTLAAETFTATLHDALRAPEPDLDRAADLAARACRACVAIRKLHDAA